MSLKTTGIGLLVLGLLVIAVFLLADVLGIGKDPSVFGPYQITGAVVGLLVALAGAWIAFRKK